MHAQAHSKNVIGLNDRASLPSPPRTVEDTGLHVLFLVELAAKILFLRGRLRLTELSQHLKLPATVVDAVLSFMRTERICEVARRGETDGDVHYNLTDTGSWVVHGGYGTDRSPVGPHDTVFTKVDLQKLTGGISARTSRFVGSIGVQYLTGTSDPIELRQLPNGQLSTVVAVHNLGLVYSLSVTF